MKEKFLNLIDMHQGIIHKILSIYTYNKEDRKDLIAKKWLLPEGSPKEDREKPHNR